MFFCKDCDGYRVQGKKIAIVGNNNEAVDYALGMLQFTSCVLVATNGASPGWDEEHQSWLVDFEIQVFGEKIEKVDSNKGFIRSITLAGDTELALDGLFTTRGDLFHNKLATMAGAELDSAGQVVVDHCGRTNVPGIYAAGCVTPANCQMIVAAGQGAIAAQAINRDLFEQSLRDFSLKKRRQAQLDSKPTDPVIISTESGGT